MSIKSKNADSSKFDDLDRTELTKAESPEGTPHKCASQTEGIKIFQSTPLIPEKDTEEHEKTIFGFNEKPEQEKDSGLYRLPATNTLFNRSKNKKFATAKILNKVHLQQSIPVVKEDAVIESTEKSDNIIGFRRKSTILEVLEMRSKLNIEEIKEEEG